MAKNRRSAGGTPVKIKASGTGTFGDNPAYDGSSKANSEIQNKDR